MLILWVFVVKFKARKSQAKVEKVRQPLIFLYRGDGLEKTKNSSIATIQIITYQI
jgi:hypothetical protein